MAETCNEGWSSSNSKINAFEEDPPSIPLLNSWLQAGFSIAMSQIIREVPQKLSNKRGGRPLRQSNSCYGSPVENSQKTNHSDYDGSSINGSSVVGEELDSSDQTEPLKDKGNNEVPGLEGIFNRLKELSAGFEELQLSEEQLRNNDREQDEELLALKAIYGEDVSVFHMDGEMRALQIQICLEASDDLSLSAKLHSTTEGYQLRENATTSDTNSLNILKVQHLPPVVLTCLLPQTYPSHRPPHFAIYVQWLDSSRIYDLCCMLDSIWGDQPGQVVVYQWAEWLHVSSLPHLGFDREVTLGPYPMLNAGDGRAISGCTSPEGDISLLMSFNREKFCKSLHTCAICFGDYVGTEFIRLPCQHFFCHKCMKIYSNMHVKEGEVSKLICPDAKCGSLLPPGLLNLLLSEEAFKRWESLLLQKTLDTMPDVEYCPRCGTACLKDEDNHVQCAMSFFRFCSLCWKRRHIGTSCMDYKTSILKVLMQGVKHRRKLLEKFNELRSLKVIRRIAKQCPSCNMAISKIDGCNKMVCRNCTKVFCYRCNKAITGYDHFRKGSCALYQ
ncbi:hypothetical protein AMTRI_Chr03g51740 [Amborella trichopoda]|uniref:E3 ubiquitin-protein ligase RNF14 n=1 Tax=Amborella trichopoda TaxID=13333 RepID=UPI0005D3B5E8|nr:E3 ubiquitin-protein ligase RNF14 [Amborella trichopoda]|eukprot:XP_011626899.1 E3 ubiquitin-protein ligase RNF14 [Amborella trichopoda]